MVNKIIKFICWLIIVSTLIIAGINIVTDNPSCLKEYFKLNYQQTMTIITGVLITFWAVQYKNDLRKRKDHFELLIEKLQTTIKDPSLYVFNKTADKSEEQKRINSTNRKISNNINVLKQYAKLLNFKKEIEYIDDEFKKYKNFVSNHITDLDYLSKSENDLQLYLQNIDSKCDAIVFELYKY